MNKKQLIDALRRQYPDTFDDLDPAAVDDWARMATAGDTDLVPWTHAHDLCESFARSQGLEG